MVTPEIPLIVGRTAHKKNAEGKPLCGASATVVNDGALDLHTILVCCTACRMHQAK